MNNGKPKICWVESFGQGAAANILGYATHNAMMKKYCQEVIDFDVEHSTALTIQIADKFYPLPGKKNILFSMWEFNDLPKPFIEGINKADHIIVPSSFCRDLFRRYTKKPIHVCWEGIEPENYPFYQRHFPRINYKERFRFLWIGAPNPRKGYLTVLEAIKLVEKVPELELYIKTTSPRKPSWPEQLKILAHRAGQVLLHRTKKDVVELEKSIKRAFTKDPGNQLLIMGPHKNIYVDTRKLPVEELRGLYNSAHCFLLPTLGEGWGLTLCEAMATGCPSIATNVTGIKEFFSPDVGYEIKYEQKEVGKGSFRDYPDLNTTGFFPDTKHCLEQMIYVFQHYGEALKKGQRASERIHSKFTWRHSAHRLKDILQEIEKEPK